MEVVCGLIIHNKKVLLGQRPLYKSKGGLWEFPGGKLEQNESREKALCRELKEELNLNIPETSLNFLGSLSETNMTLSFYSLFVDQPYIPKEHRSVCWAFLKDINLLNLCPQDLKATQLFSAKLKSLF